MWGGSGQSRGETDSRLTGLPPSTSPGTPWNPQSHLETTDPVQLLFMCIKKTLDTMEYYSAIKKEKK